MKLRNYYLKFDLGKFSNNLNQLMSLVGPTCGLKKSSPVDPVFSITTTTTKG